ncbi:hypothetical protein EMIT040CA3_70019 [Bacillus pseudomycoides]
METWSIVLKRYCKDNIFSLLVKMQSFLKDKQEPEYMRKYYVDISNFCKL